MKAVRIHAFGNSGVLKYEDAPLPETGPDEVLVKVHACGVNPVDWKIREGFMEPMVHHTLPLTLGWDVAGTVEKTGNLVKRFKKGDPVFCRPDTLRNGGYAEYITVKTIDLASAPRNIPFDQAAGIPLASQAAWMALFEVAGQGRPEGPYPWCIGRGWHVCGSACKDCRCVCYRDRINEKYCDGSIARC